MAKITRLNPDGMREEMTPEQLSEYMQKYRALPGDKVKPAVELKQLKSYATDVKNNEVDDAAIVDDMKTYLGNNMYDEIANIRKTKGPKAAEEAMRQFAAEEDRLNGRTPVAEKSAPAPAPEQIKRKAKSTALKRMATKEVKPDYSDVVPVRPPQDTSSVDAAMLSAKQSDAKPGETANIGQQSDTAVDESELLSDFNNSVVSGVGGRLQSKVDSIGPKKKIVMPETDLSHILPGQQSDTAVDESKFISEFNDSIIDSAGRKLQSRIDAIGAKPTVVMPETDLSYLLSRQYSSPSKLRDEDGADISAPPLAQAPPDDSAAQAEFDAMVQPSAQGGESPVASAEAAQQTQNQQQVKSPANNQEDIRALLDRYNSAVAERNSGVDSGMNLAAMRAFNYQKAGANIAARDLYDPSTADGAMKSYNEEMRLGDRQRELARQQMADENTSRKNATDAQADDPNSDYSKAMVEQAAKDLNRPELSGLSGKLSANQVQKILGNVVRPSFQADQKMKGLDRNIQGQKEIVGMGIEGRQAASNAKYEDADKARGWKSGENEKDRQARLAEIRAREESRARIQAYSRQHGGTKGVDIKHGALVPLVQGSNPKIAPQAEKVYGAGLDARKLIGDMQSALEEMRSINPVSINTDSGPGARYLSARAQLLESESLLKEQGVVREADMKNFENKIPDITTIKGSFRDVVAGGKLMNNVKYFKESIDSNVNNRLKGYGLREAMPDEDLAQAWGGKYSAPQKAATSGLLNFRAKDTGELLQLRQDQYDALSEEEKKAIERVR